MTLMDIWRKRGKAEGIAEGIGEGKAKGAIAVVLSMYANRTLSANEARAQLKLLGEQGLAPKAKVSRTLQKLAK